MSQESSYELFTRDTQAIIYNFKAQAVQRMLDFDFLVKREKPSVAGLVRQAGSGFHKAFFGSTELLLPCYGSVAAASQAHPAADVLINFASARSAYPSTLSAMAECPRLRVIVIIAEGVPEREVRHLIVVSKARGVTIIGPATVGGVRAGAFKIGDAAGTTENIIRCHLYRPGSVGFVSKSGGMSNECYSICARAADGVYEGLAIGGDAYPCTTLGETVLRYEANPNIKLMVLLGELGDSEEDEYTIVELLRAKRITKPIVCWVAGTCASLFTSDVQFGHAGARSGTDRASAGAKQRALRDAGALVPTSFDGFEGLIREAFLRVAGGEKAIFSPGPSTVYPTKAEAHEREFKMTTRKATSFMTTISDDRGEEPVYCGVPISELTGAGASVGDVIGLLWFKRRFPPWASRFLELCIILTADHGPCVSGAHNTIVASRAGKDLVSALCSGLLTIGPRFGGALDEAAATWLYGVTHKITPLDLVEKWKDQGKVIAGIGHRIKSVFNPDKRVTILRQYAAQHFPSQTFLNYAVAIEAVTTKKGNNLILNVDGCIAAMFLDCLFACTNCTEKELQETVDTGVINGLFVLARSIGLIGHTLDQKRLKEPLYRHPWDDVLFKVDHL